MVDIINKVQRSGLVTLDLEDYFPKEIKLFDLKENLFQGLVLREKEFREFLKRHDWTQYTDKPTAIFCSTDAIIPTWAYMLVMTYLTPVTNDACIGTESELMSQYYKKIVTKLVKEDYKDVRVVIKGCGNKEVPLSAYGDIVSYLQNTVKSLMFGEPCSTVPLYKMKKNV